jgi:hypothetical protein
VGPRAGLDTVKNRKFLTLPGLKLRLLSGPAGRQSLYRPRYPGSNQMDLSPKVKAADPSRLVHVHDSVRNKRTLFLLPASRGADACAPQSQPQ